MDNFEFANLYVEKYDNGNLLLDFTIESEFIYYLHRGDYTDEMKLNSFTPSMLLFKNAKIKGIREGDIISVCMKELMRHEKISEILREENRNSNQRDEPYVIRTIYDDSSWLENLFDDSNLAFKKKRAHLPKQPIEHLSGEQPPDRFLSGILHSGNVNVEVVDVGQGSTNLIYDNYNKVIFDFGSSFFYPKEMLERIADDIKCKLNGLKHVLIIISHWDCDHYNLLSVIDDTSLAELGGAILPGEIITMTAKQIARRLERNCKNIVTIESPVRRKGCKWITPVNKAENCKDNCLLFCGTKSRNRNKSGLALMITTKNEVTLLTADHTNEQIWNCIYHDFISNESRDENRRLNIVVPHHGGSCGRIKIDHLCMNAGIAAISVGKNPYKHPLQSTIDFYNGLGFDVIRTDWERENIIIQMK